MQNYYIKIYSDGQQPVSVSFATIAIHLLDNLGPLKFYYRITENRLMPKYYANITHIRIGF